MKLDPTTLIRPENLKVDHVALMPNGAIVLEIPVPDADGNIPTPGLGIRIPLDHGDQGLLALTSWSSIPLAPGEILGVEGTIGLQVENVKLSAEIDLAGSAPFEVGRPAGPLPPALTIRDGEPLILAVRRPESAVERHWTGFSLKGASEPYYKGKSIKTVGFGKWVLVLTLDERRIEIRIG